MDITPVYNLLPAEQELVFPPSSGDSGPQVVGGFMATPNSLTQGNLSLSGASEQITVGLATSPTVGVGIFMGNDGAAAKGYDFRVGDPAGNYMWWDASAATLTLVGSLSATSGTIGGFNIGTDYVRDVANTFGLASTVTAGDDVRFWAGDTFANRATAPFRVTEAGVVTGTNVFVSGGSITGTPISSIPNNSSTDISLLEKTHTLVFSVTDLDTIAWASGTVTLSNGRTFSISAGNTGNMSALTYIYLDPAVSSTVLQTTTTAATAMGANKILLGCAQNHTVSASFIPYGPGQPLIDGSNIGALSIVAGNIAASTITAAKMSVSQLSAIAADLGSITAGSLNINSGVATIDSSGNALFKSVQIGGTTRQFTVGDAGIFSFGDGSDGAGVANGSGALAGATLAGSTYTLTRDVYYTDLTISTGVILKPSGYRIFGQGTLTLQGTAKISGDGNNGTAGTAGTNATVGTGGPGGPGGAALADGYLKGSLAGPDGGSGSSGGNGASSVAGTAGTNGTNTSNSLGSNGANSGAGGVGGADSGGTKVGGTPGAAATGGTATTFNLAPRVNSRLFDLLDVASSGSTVKYDNGASAASGGGGSGGGGNAGGISAGGGGGGGGAGSAGRIIAIYFRVIVVGASASITANGGNGGKGGDGGFANTAGGTTGGGGGGGGGGGANGGQIFLIYNVLTNSGSITVTAGTAGALGAGGGALQGGVAGTAGSVGTAGTAGTIRQFQISL